MSLLFSCDLLKVSGSLNSDGFLKLLFVELFSCKVHILTSEVFYSETNSAQLNCVELSNFVVIFAFRILQAAYHEPQPIDRLIIQFAVTVIYEESL